MVISLNSVVIAGNLVRDVETNKTNSGKTVGNFTVAVNDWNNNAAFVKVTVWEKVADNCAKYLSKGSPVIVEGKIATQSYETKNGEKRSHTYVLGRNVQFLSTGEQKPKSDVKPHYGNMKMDISQKPEDDSDIPF